MFVPGINMRCSGSLARFVRHGWRVAFARETHGHTHIQRVRLHSALINNPLSEHIGSQQSPTHGRHIP